MSQTIKSFAVVEFTEEQSVEVVSSTWIDNSKSICKWPPVSGPRIRKFVQDHTQPDSGWFQYKCRVLQNCGKYFLVPDLFYSVIYLNMYFDYA